MSILKIADIPDIWAEGAEEVPAFRVTETELRVLARYWRYVDLEIDTGRFLFAQIGDTELYFYPHVCERMDAAALVIGGDGFRELTRDIDELFRASLGDRRWEVYLHGSEEDWDAVRDEVHEEFNAWMNPEAAEGARPAGPRVLAPVVFRKVQLPEGPSADYDDEFLKELRKPPGKRKPTPWGPRPIVFGRAPRGGPRIDAQEQPGFTANMDELTVLAGFWGTVLVEATVCQPPDTHHHPCSNPERRFAEHRAARLLKLIGRDRAEMAADYARSWACVELGERCDRLFPCEAGAEEHVPWPEFWARLFLDEPGADPGASAAGGEPQSGQT